MQAAIKTIVSGFALALVGCATTSDFDKLDSRVAALESKMQTQAGQIAALESKMSDVEAKADRSVAQATAAAERAEEAARKADAIFKKSVSK